MHGQIDGAGKERVLDLLSKQPLATGLRKRPVLDRIARGADGFDFDPLRVEASRGGKAVAHLARLRERKRGAA